MRLPSYRRRPPRQGAAWSRTLGTIIIVIDGTISITITIATIITTISLTTIIAGTIITAITIITGVIIITTSALFRLSRWHPAPAVPCSGVSLDGPC
jgi:ABC-type multidrug transport system permease subunit